MHSVAQWIGCDGLSEHPHRLLAQPLDLRGRQQACDRAALKGGIDLICPQKIVSTPSQ